MAIPGPYNGWPKAILEHDPSGLRPLRSCRPTGLRPVGLTNVREMKKSKGNWERSDQLTAATRGWTIKIGKIVTKL